MVLAYMKITPFWVDEVVVMKKPPKDHSQIENQHSVRELRQELRAMGYRLTGNEAYEDLLRLLKEELNRQWFQSASRGSVIRRRKTPASSH
jgi:hypothetical protein